MKNDRFDLKVVDNNIETQYKNNIIMTIKKMKKKRKYDDNKTKNAKYVEIVARKYRNINKIVNYSL